MAPVNALEVRDLRKRFGAVEALRGVSFTVAPGEVFGYLGPNGAGKTTTLRIVLGLVRPGGGSANLMGVPSTDPASRTDAGFLPGDLHLYADMTGAATLDFFARLRPARAPVLRNQLMHEFGIDASTLARRVKFLSHGTRQKLGLIAAMQHDPALLLLDEPTNGLDPLVQQAFRAIVAGFAQRGRAVMLSSHVLSEVEAVCTRVAILRQGEVVALETIDNLRRKVVRRMTVRFAGGALPDLGGVAGVTRAEVHGREMALQLLGDVGPVLRALAPESVEDLVYPEAQLEDIFLAHYKPEGSDA